MKKVMILDWGFFSRESTVSAFRELGYEVVFFKHAAYQERVSSDFEEAYNQFIDKESPDLCFSWNYYPVLSEACHKAGMLYISFLYDNPYVMLYSYTLAYETNRVFLFDRHEYKVFAKGGLQNVYYMPLPGDPSFRDLQCRQPYDPKRVEAEISFVGGLYNEQHNFYEMMEKQGDKYLNGYLEGVMDAQHLIYGSSLIGDTLTPEILEHLKKAFPYEPDRGSIESPSYIYENYLICRKLTSKERFRYLQLIGSAFPGKCRLYTLDQSVFIPGVRNMGIAEYTSEMPQVFRHSKINLNFTLRSIVSGAPLRVLDIMACGGFLLSNYQEDMAEMFVPNEEVVLFESEEDMLDKIAYYLEHDKERKEIARAGRERMKRDYNFVETFRKILEISGEI